MRVERIIAPQMAICSNPIGSPILTIWDNIALRNGHGSFRRIFRLGEETHTTQSFAMQITMVARAVPSAAPGTPKNWMNSRLKTTSKPHMAASRMAGVRIFPLHWSMEPARVCSWKAGREQS